MKTIHITKKILKMLYPDTCVFCGEICESGICESCRQKVKEIQEPLCKKCGKPIQSEEAEFCYDCQNTEFHYEQGRSLWLHEKPAANAIYAFKYKNRRVYGEVFAKEMAKKFQALVREWEIDLIIPVPIHKKRRRKRGYNQAEILAKELGRIWGIPVDCSLVVRNKETAPQKELGQGNRKRNLRKAFSLTRSISEDRTILIVDDIYTTGSTINSMAQLLKKEGNEKIYFLTISIGQGF